jgi:hypothetical protein
MGFEQVTSSDNAFDYRTRVRQDSRASFVVLVYCCPRTEPAAPPENIEVYINPRRS